MIEKVMVDNEEYWRAVLNWNTYWEQGTRFEKDIAKPFIDFIGQDDYRWLPSTGQSEFTVAQARKIRALAGPYSAALIKAYLIVEGK